MGHGHRHADLLDYTLAQVRGYSRAHRAHDAHAAALRMDSHRVAVNADADAYADFRTGLLEPVQAEQREPAWKSAWRSFAAAGALPDVESGAAVQMQPAAPG